MFSYVWSCFNSLNSSLTWKEATKPTQLNEAVTFEYLSQYVLEASSLCNLTLKFTTKQQLTKGYFIDICNNAQNDEESKKWQKIDCVSFIKLFSKAFWAKIYNGKIFEKVDDPRLKFNINNTYSHKMKVLSESFEEDNTYVSKLFEQFKN